MLQRRETNEKKNALVQQMTEAWLADIRPTVKESTYTRYHGIIRKYMLAYWHQTPVHSIDSEEIAKRLEQIRIRAAEHPLSGKTFSGIVHIWRSVWKWGKVNGYRCCDFPDIPIPPKRRPPIHIIPPESRKALEETILHSEERIALGIIFSLFTGIRIGELCGLRWGDIDFENGLVNICRTVERIADLDPYAPKKTKVILSEPKTAHSLRIIPLPDFLLHHLQPRRQANHCYVLTGNARYTEPHTCYVRYKRFLKQHQLGDYTFHALRHTFATTCVDIGFDTKTLSEILGHADVATTMMLYVHPTMQMKRRQMNMIKPLCPIGRSEEI